MSEAVAARRAVVDAVARAHDAGRADVVDVRPVVGGSAVAGQASLGLVGTARVAHTASAQERIDMSNQRP